MPPRGSRAAGRAVRLCGGPAMTAAGRIVIGTLGLDQHEVGAMAISQILVRHGYEVIYLGRFNTPERLAAVAVQEDADIVGVSVHSWEFTGYADDLVHRCRELGIGLVFGGSVLTDRDRADLTARGADAVFGPYAALRRYGQVHGLVANAGLLRSGPILRLSDEDLRLLLDVHVTAPFRFLRVLGGYWRGEVKAGRPVPAAAVLTTSAAGLYGFRAEAAYSAAKAAVAMLAKVAADALGRLGVTVYDTDPAALIRLYTWHANGTAPTD